MAERRGQTGNRIELGIRLRRLRESAGLTMKDAVRGLPFSEAKLQRVETGHMAFRQINELKKLLRDRYGVSDAELFESLVELNRQSASQDWLTPYRNYLLKGMSNFVGVESEAHALRVYHPTLVHSLLQTENYARALFEIEKPVEETTSEFIRRNVEVRMLRKEPLFHEENPTKLWAVLTENALRYVVGDGDIMSEQYAELIKLTAMDNVRIQVLPSASRGFRAVADFAILDLGDRLPTMVQVDTAWGAVSTSEKRPDVDRFTRRFDAMIASALPPEETADFLRRLDRELTAP